MYCDAIIDDYIDGPTIRKSRKTVRFAEDTKSVEFSLHRKVEEILYCITRDKKGGFDIIKEIITFDNRDDILDSFIDLYNRYQ